MSDLTKLDTALFQALRAWEEDRTAADDDGISVTLRFEGELAPVEALGFDTMSVFEDQALGVIRFRDIEAIAALPNVLSIAAGRPPRKLLLDAVYDGRVRASSKANVGTDGLWHITDAGAEWTATADATGAGVVIAVLDTGIDYTHPMFLETLAPKKKTRILRIWDQGLPPASESECPDGALLLDPTKRYGVEYKEAAINDALNGVKKILHKDCDGHGTHVAGIAAGGTRFPPGGDAARVGVAPEAALIVVKLLDGPEKIRYRTAAGFGAEVGWNAQFRDAVLYCLRVARGMTPKRPIVINTSFGDATLPGDGLDENARWLDALLDPTKPEDKDHFPNGAIVVRAAGNEGDLMADRLTATVKVPASGEVTVPLALVDGRKGHSTRWTNCKRVVHKPSVEVNFWYRVPAGAVKFAVKLPHQTAFGSEVAAGGKLEQGFRIDAGPPKKVTILAPPTALSPAMHRFTLIHRADSAVPHPSGGTVHRHNVDLIVEPKVSGSTVSYAAGTYEVLIKAPAGTEIFVMGEIEEWGHVFVHFQLGKPLPAGVVLTNDSSATDTLGRHAIAVAAYDDDNRRIADFSSRGPLRDFSNPAGSKPRIGTKPELAAPGFEVESAESIHIEKPAVTPSGRSGIRFTPKSGTSMASPFVAGVVALLLDKKPTLTAAQVRTALTTGAAGRPGEGPKPADPGYANAFGSGMVDALKSHTSI